MNHFSPIIFFQETHLTDQKHDKIKKMRFIPTYYSSLKTGRKRGVAVLMPNKVNFELQSEIKDHNVYYGKGQIR